MIRSPGIKRGGAVRIEMPTKKDVRGVTSLNGRFSFLEESLNFKETGFLAIIMKKRVFSAGWYCNHDTIGGS